MVKKWAAVSRREVAQRYVEACRLGAKADCLAFGISQTGYRYEAKLNAE